MIATNKHISSPHDGRKMLSNVTSVYLPHKFETITRKQYYWVVHYIGIKIQFLIKKLGLAMVRSIQTNSPLAHTADISDVILSYTK